jgi:dipeptidyl aminopeptidase/acylaminoacyl peptidase
MMRVPIRAGLLSCIISFFATVCLRAQQMPSSWTPEMQLKLRTPLTPVISPDGKYVAYTVSSAMMTPDKSETNMQVWVTSFDGKETLQVTSGEKSSSNPHWSPDGKTLAFTSNRVNNRNNIFIQHWPGGEAKQLTDLKGNVAAFEFSPAGNKIAFAMADPKSQEEEKNDKGRNDYRWIDENLKFTRMYVIDLNSEGDAKPQPVQLTSGNTNVLRFDWSPDAKTIVINHNNNPVLASNSAPDVSLVDIATGKITPLVFSDVGEAMAQFTPDGKYVSFIAAKKPIPGMYNEYELKMIAVNGGPQKILPPLFDGRTTLFPGWAADGKYYFSEVRGTIMQLFSVDPASNKVEKLPSTGTCTGISIDPSGKYFAMVKQEWNKPPEVYVSSVSVYNPVPITNLNKELSAIPLGNTKLIHWKSFDGKEIEGLLTYPVNYKTGMKVPLILFVHGGPNGVFQQSFIGSPTGEYPIASLAAEGFAVLCPNPRGSCGYGTAFRRSNLRDFGGGDYKDLMSGVDKVIAMGVGDPERLGVMGWSYGGFMTEWIVTHTKRFKAASAGAAPANFLSMVGTTDFPQMLSAYMNAEHWEDQAIYQKLSPINYVKNVSTPTMIQHGEADIRVPVSQGYEFYFALKKRGVPAKMLVLPRQPHVPGEPKMQLIVMQSNIDWFKKYLMPAKLTASK